MGTLQEYVDRKAQEGLIEVEDILTDEFMGKGSRDFIRTEKTLKSFLLKAERVGGKTKSYTQKLSELHERYKEYVSYGLIG